MSALLNLNNYLPDFANFNYETMEEDLRSALAQYRKAMESLLDREESQGRNFILELERIHDNFERIWGPVMHLNGVTQSKKLRTIVENLLPEVSETQTKIFQDKRLFTRCENYLEVERHEPKLKKIFLDLKLDLELNGINLDGEKQKRFQEIQVELGKLSQQFSNNVLDDTNDFSLLLYDDEEIRGLNESYLSMARERAEKDKAEDQNGKPAYKITLEMPFYIGFMTHSLNSDLRKKMYYAYLSRASQGERNNAPIMLKILQLKQERARLLGYNNHAEYSLADKMASSPEEVIQFLKEIHKKSKNRAQQDLQQLKDKNKQFSSEDLQSWDLAFLQEKLKQEELKLSEEALKPYFSIDRVLQTLFDIIEKHFDLCFEPGEASLWHEDAKYYQMKRNGNNAGGLYMDLYARSDKRGGAWMDECRKRRLEADSINKPVAYIVCNFSPPSKDKPALLTHSEVTTLFHEMGHALHLLTTTEEYASISGLSAVPWDGVELPSQFMEGFCYEKEILRTMAKHYENGDVLDDNSIQRIKDSLKFQTGYSTLRQLEFSLFDMKLHSEFNGDKPEDIHTFLLDLRKEYAVFQSPEDVYFENGFLHIFAGGYSAGYYSYKWAEVLAADAFDFVRQKGVLNPQGGQRFMKELLSRGGSDDFMQLYKNFRGSKPSVDALLKRDGII